MWQPVETRDFNFFLNQMAKVTETTSTTLHYGLLILLKYPEVAGFRAGETQNGRLWFGDGWRVPKCAAHNLPWPPQGALELDTVARRPRTPSLDDHMHLPYTNAVLLEIQRFISVVLPRTLIRDTYL
ncbi:cytochrome P450 2C23-like isoform X1 [Callithrix jacchus]